MLLEMKDIVKVYGQVVANDHVSFSLDKGEILAVVGENGAGKSTIMKVLYGMEKATSGEIFLNGEKMHFRSPAVLLQRELAWYSSILCCFRQ